MMIIRKKRDTVLR